MDTVSDVKSVNPNNTNMTSSHDFGKTSEAGKSYRSSYSEVSKDSIAKERLEMYFEKSV